MGNPELVSLPLLDFLFPSGGLVLSPWEVGTFEAKYLAHDESEKEYVETSPCQ